jgi:hypothetical protein
MQTGSSKTLIGWKSGKITNVPLWDRMEGERLWTQLTQRSTVILGEICTLNFNADNCKYFLFFFNNTLWVVRLEHLVNTESPVPPSPSPPSPPPPPSSYCFSIYMVILRFRDKSPRLQPHSNIRKY